MGKFLTDIFDVQGHRYYYRDWKKKVYSIDSQQAQSISSRLDSIFFLVIGGGVGVAVLAVYFVFLRLSGPAEALFKAGPVSLLAMTCLIATCYWAVVGLLSYRTWNEISRMAKSEPEDHGPEQPNSTLTLITPMGILLCALLSLSLLGAAFGLAASRY